jgi:hypothetical protein
MSDDEDEVEREDNNISDRVTQYLANDDIIIKKKKEKTDFNKKIKEDLKPLIERKEKLEKYIIKYYDEKKIDELDLNINGVPNGKLIKSEVTRKKPIKLELIQECIVNEIGKEINGDKMIINKDKLGKIIENIVSEIEKNRPVTTKVELKHKQSKDRVKINDKIKKIIKEL